ncbi:MAG: hypothetical protein H8K08_16985 [Nitrospira sp.]|nr:hypothetical protein [Nitrospira sp.]
MDTMRMRRPLVLGLIFSLTSLLPVAWAVEEGELVGKEGRWGYVTREDPALKYLLEKHIITQEEYDEGARIVEEREHPSAPSFHLNYGQGLNIETGDQFFLKLRGLMQFRFNHNEYNQAWRTIGDRNNFAGDKPAEAWRRADQSATTLSTQAMRLQFLGYAFDPNLRYDVTIGADRQEGSPTATGGLSLVNAYVASWHVPYANVVVGQYKTWFNRAQIQSIANLTFTTRMIVQNAFMANAINRRDIGITILSDENKYRVNYAIGVFNGMGTTLDRLSNPIAQDGTRVNANELMYVGRLLWKVSGNPLYGEGDILYSTEPQVAIAVGYAYNPGVNLSDPITAVRNQVLGVSGNGRLVGAGIIDFQTWEMDFIARYRGWALQAEGYVRQQQVRGGNFSVGNAMGWYAMLGYYLVPRKLEVAVRYGIFDPNTGYSHDLVKEAGVALNYSLDGTYDHRIVADFTNVTMGTGGYAAGRPTVSTQDLVTNSIRVLYQFYW